ncbi:hypothetical protein Nepgr_012000 [Nepenthes gracilis]|uniref:Uncharacterized protein n=1 Tax=Nepenthes gracilis TaxID=150966 RepID=A0AAD3SGC1_NEPGR|nr:hypothetical protein Nepgr_012000 [Nepenthes gracilis]
MGMSSNSDLLEEKQMKCDILKRSSSIDSIAQQQKQKQAEEDSKLQTVRGSSSTKSHETMRSLGELQEVDDATSNDGFRTPTSLDHKIPEIRPCCPPPPRKLMPKQSRKRKFSDPEIRSGRHSISSSNRLLDLTVEVESMFPPLLQANIGRKIKKARSF